MNLQYSPAALALVFAGVFLFVFGGLCAVVYSVNENCGAPLRRDYGCETTPTANIRDERRPRRRSCPEWPKDFKARNQTGSAEVLIASDVFVSPHPSGARRAPRQLCCAGFLHFG